MGEGVGEQHLFWNPLLSFNMLYAEVLNII